jgi:CheY-like chemotaxis protein
VLDRVSIPTRLKDEGLLRELVFLAVISTVSPRFMQEAVQIKEQLIQELKQLLHTLGGDSEKVALLISAFQTETPQYFSTLNQLITTHQGAAARQLLHTLKARYGYFGFQQFMQEMDAWEAIVDNPFDLQHNLERIQYFEKWNRVIMSQLHEASTILTDQHMVANNLPLSGKRILIAEDDEVNFMVFEVFVQELGGTAIKAADGHEAIRQTTDQTPDFIFMDIHMPYFSGVEAIRFIRSKGIQVPIVALSASTRLQEKQQALAAGANDFLTKPTKRDVIREILLKHFS